ncbi:MAG: epoxyqueuosine reductase [Promethearchaeota archaeon]
MTLTDELKKRAMDAGFVTVGITTPEKLHGLPHGWVHTVQNLRTPEEVLPNVKSVMVLGYYAWDKSLNIAVDSTYLRDRDKRTPEVSLERYQLYYEILKNKAWTIVEYLTKRGHETCLTLSIPLKTSAVRCGMGSQGKNTLLINPTYGPRIRLIAILTDAELTTDDPFTDDLCGDCEKCLKACPTKALEPYKIKITRCLTYAAEQPQAQDVSKEVRDVEKKLTQRPTPNSYIECIICIDACPIGRPRRTKTH